MNRLTICSIGAGNMSRSGHGPALRAIADERADIDLAAVCGLEASAVEAYAKTFGYRAW